MLPRRQRIRLSCAEKAIAVLNGAAPGEIAITQADSPDIILNRFCAANLGIEICAELLNDAKEIID